MEEYDQAQKCVQSNDIDDISCRVGRNRSEDKILHTPVTSPAAATVVGSSTTNTSSIAESTSTKLLPKKMLHLTPVEAEERRLKNNSNERVRTNGIVDALTSLGHALPPYLTRQKKWTKKFILGTAIEYITVLEDLLAGDDDSNKSDGYQFLQGLRIAKERMGPEWHVTAPGENVHTNSNYCLRYPLGNIKNTADTTTPCASMMQQTTETIRIDNIYNRNVFHHNTSTRDNDYNSATKYNSTEYGMIQDLPHHECHQHDNNIITPFSIGNSLTSNTLSPPNSSTDNVNHNHHPRDQISRHQGTQQQWQQQQQQQQLLMLHQQHQHPCPQQQFTSRVIQNDLADPSEQLLRPNNYSHCTRRQWGKRPPNHWTNDGVESVLMKRMNNGHRDHSKPKRMRQLTTESGLENTIGFNSSNSTSTLPSCKFETTSNHNKFVNSLEPPRTPDNTGAVSPGPLVGVSLGKRQKTLGHHHVTNFPASHCSSFEHPSTPLLSYQHDPSFTPQSDISVCQMNNSKPTGDYLHNIKQQIKSFIEINQFNETKNCSTPKSTSSNSIDALILAESPIARSHFLSDRSLYSPPKVMGHKSGFVQSFRDNESSIYAEARTSDYSSLGSSWLSSPIRQEPTRNLSSTSCAGQSDRSREDLEVDLNLGEKVHLEPPERIANSSAIWNEDNDSGISLCLLTE